MLISGPLERLNLVAGFVRLALSIYPILRWVSFIGFASAEGLPDEVPQQSSIDGFRLWGRRTMPQGEGAICGRLPHKSDEEEVARRSIKLNSSDADDAFLLEVQSCLAVGIDVIQG